MLETFFSFGWLEPLFGVIGALVTGFLGFLGMFFGM
uniref:Uncharacterized protein n=1 Tax=uncultured Planctomycetota bacterium TaxID=120965 RepID=A0A5B8JP99_9BACT|nr:hypothetical protein fos2004AM_00006 [uncultured Planctomycetota bacterium]